MADTPISIFISYSRTNADFVDRLERDLESKDFLLWVDRSQIEGGDEWLDKIENAIDNCSILLVILSPAATTSKYVKMEYRYARHLDKLVIPLYLQHCAKVPMDLNGIHWVRFLDYDKGLKDLSITLGSRKLNASEQVPLPLHSHQKFSDLANITEESPLVAPCPLPTQPSRLSRLAGLIILLLMLLLSAGLILTQFINMISLAPSGIVSITPDSKSISDTYTLTGANTTNTTTRTVAVRTIAGTAQSTIVQVNATGQINRTVATHAHGFITFFNGAPTSQQVNAGTKVPIAGGVTLVTDENTSIPPITAREPKTVAAHAMPAGSVGNIKALVLNNMQCCGTYIVARSATDFTGGLNAGPYKFLQKSDVTNAVTQQTQDTTQQNAMNDLKKQLHPGEQFFGATQCTPTFRMDQLIGDQGKNVSSANITYRIKCTSTTYDYAGAQTVVSELLARKAATTLPHGYKVINTQVSLINQITANNMTSFFFSGDDIWVYQFSDQQKQNLAKSIAGKSVAEAEAILKNTPSVAGSAMTNISNNLPTDPNQISIEMQQPSGLDALPTPTVAQPTVTTPTFESSAISGGP